MQIKDRIKEFKRVKASDLIPNEKNWRKHPKAQRDALRGVLDEIGYANALLAYETPEGLKLIDGHLRAETTPEMEVPVLVLDVTESEAYKILATLDPLGAMAETDGERLDNLMRQVQTSNQAVAGMLAGLANDAGLYSVKEEGGENDIPPMSKGAINYILIFDTEEQQNRWYAWLKSLKEQNPEAETHSERIDDYLKSHGE